jgi:hypothetical protein
MGHLQRTAIWTAALSALSGTGFVAAFLSGKDTQTYLLMAAAVAATISVAALLCSVLVVCLVTTRRFEAHLMQPDSRDARLIEDGTESASLHTRREILNGRLHVDKPHVCSQHMVPCTCWSYCGRLPDQDAVLDGASRSPEEPVRVRCELSKPQGVPLPVVHRNGMDDCPLRYASSAAWPICVDSGLPIISGRAEKSARGRSQPKSARAGG